MGKVKVTLAIGIALTIAAVAFALTRAPARVLRQTEGFAPTILGVTQREPVVCQSNETIPAGTTAIRLSTAAFFGTNLRLVAYHEGRVLTTGSRGPEWTGTSATIHVDPVARRISNVTLCFVAQPNSQMLVLFGQDTPARDRAAAMAARKLGDRQPTTVAERTSGRLKFEYLAPGTVSWWSRASAVVTHMGYGHFIAGPVIAVLAALFMIAVAGLAMRLTLREQA